MEELLAVGPTPSHEPTGQQHRRQSDHEQRGGGEGAEGDRGPGPFQADSGARCWPGGDLEILAELIDSEIERWQDDAIRPGLRNHPLADPEALAGRARRNLAGYGPLTGLLEDPDVWEVMVNSPSSIFVRRHRGPSGLHPEVFHDDAHVARTVTKLLDDSSASHRKLDPSEGLQDAQLDNGARVHIVHGDLTRGGHLVINIRKFTGVAISELSTLVELGSLTAEAADFLAAAVRGRASIVFAGAPGSGKTTLLSCCAAQLDPTLRVVIAEEVFEADIPLANVAGLQTRPARTDRTEVDLRRLVSGFLRMAPDVAIVGEVRDREALPFLLTLSSGVTGYTTIHAASSRQALARLRFVAQLADAARDLPLSALNALVADSVDLVVHTERTPPGPRVTSILAVEDLAAGTEATNLTATEVFTRTSSGLQRTGSTPVRLRERMGRRGETLPWEDRDPDRSAAAEQSRGGIGE
ncbi:MAG: ATPase, T2SS/T4P/T4SS family [Microthrixaceae bacterium]